MSSIRQFQGLDIPSELEDLLTPLLPFLLNFYASPTSLRLEFYFPSGKIQYDIEKMQKYFHDIDIHIDYSEPIYSIDSPRDEPIVGHRRLGEVVSGNLKIDEYTRTKKSSGATERTKKSTSIPPALPEGRPQFPPQRFA